MKNFFQNVIDIAGLKDEEKTPSNSKNTSPVKSPDLDQGRNI